MPAMNLPEASVALRCANLLFLLLWLKELQLEGLLVSLWPVYSVFAVVILANAAAAGLGRASSWPARAGLVLADFIVIAWSALWAQIPAVDAHLALLVPSLVAASTLEASLAGGVTLSAIVAWAALWNWGPGGKASFLPRAAVLALASTTAWWLGEVSWRRRRGQGVSPVLSVGRSLLFNEFLSHILFQFREYLTSITSVSSHLSLSASEPVVADLGGKLEKMIAELNAKIGRMFDTVQSNTTTRGVRRTAEFELGPLLKECLDVVRSTYPHAQVEARLACAPEIGRIQGDWETLRTVFCAVLSNAYEAVERNGLQGTLSIAALRKGQAAEVEVTDDAGGIPPDQQRMLFQPLYTTKAAFGGVGLGLSMSRRMMERTGGTVLLKSSGGRTSVTVRVPLKPSLPIIRDAESTWAGRRQNI